MGRSCDPRAISAADHLAAHGPPANLHGRDYLSQIISYLFFSRFIILLYIYIYIESRCIKNSANLKISNRLIILNERSMTKYIQITMDAASPPSLVPMRGRGKRQN